jgi:hypothetical protein
VSLAWACPIWLKSASKRSAADDGITLSVSFAILAMNRRAGRVLLNSSPTGSAHPRAQKRDTIVKHYVDLQSEEAFRHFDNALPKLVDRPRREEI